MSMAFHLVSILDRAHGAVCSATNGVSGSQLIQQFDGAPNHYLWTFGHLAVSYASFTEAACGKKRSIPETWNALFGMGSKPLSDLTAYPSFEELMAAFDQGYKDLREAALGMTDEQADEKPVVEGGGFIRSKADAVQTCAFHLGWHLGQLVLLRSKFGLGSMFA